jgi:hypothetical protein
MEKRIIDGKEVLVIEVDKWAESRKRSNKLYFEKNKEKVMENQKRWKREKRLNDEEYRLKMNEKAREYYHKKKKMKENLFIEEKKNNE